ncbi:MAG: RHS repeat domain-containing protein [Anaerocolumna sp.]
MNRVLTTSKSVEDGVILVSYQYNANGNRTSEGNERGFEKEYTYDSMTRLKTFSDAIGYIFTYAYDLAGNKIKEINAKNSTLTYRYDKLNRLKTTIDPFGIVISTREYNANGNMVRDTDVKGYDMAGRLVKSITREGNETKFEYNHYSKMVRIHKCP